MYETMRVWESDDWLTTEPAVVREYAGIWRDADKVVYSSTLEEVSTARTRIERQFEPEAVRQLKQASGSDLSIGGAAIGSWAAASRRCPGAYDSTSSCWTIDGSAMV